MIAGWKPLPRRLRPSRLRTDKSGVGALIAERPRPIRDLALQRDALTAAGCDPYAKTVRRALRSTVKVLLLEQAAASGSA